MNNFMRENLGRIDDMKLKCIKTVIMDNGTQVFTEGKEYMARKGSILGLDETDPYVAVPILKAKNDLGESHIVKRLNDESVNEFFNAHFTL